MEMKVYINKYRYHWVSPYTICEKICFWREIDYDEPWVKRTSDILTPVCTAWMKFLDIVHPKVNYVKIDKWDTWSMDSTLSPIILPMLKQLREHKHGAPWTDDEDVPKNLRSTTKLAQAAKKEEWDTDGNHFRRWDWIMDEMIWAFEQMCDEDSDAQFHTGESDIEWVPSEKLDDKGKPLTYEMKRGPNDTRKFEKKGYMKHQELIRNGTRLFGKYYQNLWD
jgi:hypothetical protein